MNIVDNELSLFIFDSCTILSKAPLFQREIASYDKTFFAFGKK